jgi:hypothetical protein
LGHESQHIVSQEDAKEPRRISSRRQKVETTDTQSVDKEMEHRTDAHQHGLFSHNRLHLSTLSGKISGKRGENQTKNLFLFEFLG